MKEIFIGQFKNHQLIEKMRTHPVANNGIGSFFTRKSGDKLFYRTWLSKETKKILIGIHGLAAHSEYYVNVADQLIEHGITVIGLDLKHHGHSTGQKGTINNFEELLTQLHEFIICISNEYKNFPIYLMGISMGGMLIINYINLFPEEISGIICMAPAVRTKLKLSFKDILKIPYLGIMNVINKHKPIIEIGARGAEGSRNPLRLEYDKVDEFRLKKVSVGYLLQVNKWVKKAFKSASKISLPILIIVGTDDHLVSIEGIKLFFGRLTVQDKTLIELEGAYHSLFSDPAMLEEGGWEKIRKWLSQRD
ncbi:MAG: alpha/beta fold hydrolase [Candidatus Helarchaeota archaeon]